MEFHLKKKMDYDKIKKYLTINGFEIAVVKDDQKSL